MDVLWFNGRWTTTDEPVVRVEDRGLQFGDAIYEVLKFRRKAPLLASRHYDRMAHCLGELAIPNPWSRAAFFTLLRELLARTSFDEGLVYLQVTRGVAPRTHAWGSGMEPTALAYTRAFSFPSDDKRRSGIDVVTLDENRWNRCDLKTTNLLANVMAKMRAAAQGAGEVLYHDGELVTECSSSSLFAVVDGCLVTREDGPAILPGTVRDAVIELAATSGIAVCRRPVRLEELASAEELFITSTSQGVMPVASVDGGSRRERGSRAELMQRLMAELEEREISGWISSPS